MDKFHIFYINLDSSTDRNKEIISMLENLSCSYSRITGYDGGKLITDEYLNEIDRLCLNKKNVIGKEFCCFETNEKWIYDGSVYKSFPGISLNGNNGTKGLTLSNLNAFHQAYQMAFFEEKKKDYFIILEDDAEINENILNNIVHFTLKNNPDILLLDDRYYGLGGTSGLLYSKKILNRLINDLEPTSNFSINSESTSPNKLANLWDWKLYYYIRTAGYRFFNLPCIKSGKFKSTISF